MYKNFKVVYNTDCNKNIITTTIIKQATATGIINILAERLQKSRLIINIISYEVI